MWFSHDMDPDDDAWDSNSDWEDNSSSPIGSYDDEEEDDENEDKDDDSARDEEYF